MSEDYEKIGKIGEGIYGKVYSLKMLDTNDDTDQNNSQSNLLAFKKNSSGTGILGIGSSLKEVDILSKLKGHPYIIDLITVSFGLPFEGDEDETDKFEDGFKDDLMHFIMEYKEEHNDKFFNEKHTIGIKVKCDVICQLFLALEYMHAKNITHRDLKPANLLISYDGDGSVNLKIIDFGMSQILSKSYCSTPEVCSSWYRAPEICCSLPNYNSAVDIWSAGCIVFELLSTKPFICINEEDMEGDELNEEILNKIWISMPIAPDVGTMNNLTKYCSFKCKTKKVKRTSFLEKLKLSTEQYSELRSYNLVDPLNTLFFDCLTLEYTQRKRATEILNSKFFEEYESFILDVRSAFNPVESMREVIVIQANHERAHLMDLAYFIFNNRDKIEWYTHKILFHSIDLYDRYMQYNSSLPVPQANDTNNTCIIFHTILYIFYKYYSTLTYSRKWEYFTPPNLHTVTVKKFAESFELFLLQKVCGYQLYRETILESAGYYDEVITDSFVRNLLMFYGQLPNWKDGSCRALYRLFKK